MSPGTANTKPRICKLSIEEQSLVAECKAERIRMLQEQAMLKERSKKLTQQIAQMGTKALATKFGVSLSTIDKIPAAGV